MALLRTDYDTADTSRLWEHFNEIATAVNTRGEFSTARPSLDLTYGTAKYTIIQWLGFGSGQWYGGLQYPVTTDAWITPGAGSWRITLHLSMLKFADPTLPCYFYIMLNVPGGTPYVNTALPTSEKVARVHPNRGGDGAETSITLDLDSTDTISTVLYQNSGAGITLQGGIEASYNSLQFERLR